MPPESDLPPEETCCFCGEQIDDLGCCPVCDSEQEDDPDDEFEDDDAE